MPDWLIAVVIIVFFAALIYVLRKHKNAITLDPLDRRRQMMIDSLTTFTTLSTGTELLSRGTLAPQFKEAAERAWLMCIEAASRRSWNTVPDPSLVRILVFPSVRDFDGGGNYSPSFKVWIRQPNFYWGGQYDKGIDPEDPDHPEIHYILAAEQLISYDPPVAVVAHYTQDWQQARNAIYFFYEHWLYQHNDPAGHQAGKATHADGSGHPIIEEMADEVNKPWQDIS